MSIWHSDQWRIVLESARDEFEGHGTLSGDEIEVEGGKFELGNGWWDTSGMGWECLSSNNKSSYMRRVEKGKFSLGKKD